MRLTIQIKLVLSIIVVAAGICFGISALAITNMQSQVAITLTEKAKSDLASAQKIIDAVYPGDWQMKDGILYKGITQINDNSEIVDEIGRLTNDTATIFLHDTRVATNVMRDGKRAVGTKAAANVVETVLDKGVPFNGEAEVAGVKYQTAYAPIKDINGKVIGMTYVGASKELADQLINTFIMKFLSIVIVILIGAAIAAWYLGRRLSRPILSAVQALQEVAGGNLGVKELAITSQDEIGQLGKAFNTMLANLRHLVDQVVQSAEKVAASSEELTASADQSARASSLVSESIAQVANGAEDQVKAVNKTSAVVEQISANIQQISDNANDVSGISENLAGTAQTGEKAVAAAVAQMTNIEQKVFYSAQAVSKLGERSQEIGQIIATISGIAEQTNLLALNAAIEAARAGEHGRGFAVVADEVRKLAEQSQVSAKQIATLIAEIQYDTNEAVMAMNEGTSEVKVGAQVVDTAGKAFQQIMVLINQVSTEIKEISAAIQQMASGSQQIVYGVRDIDKVSNETAGQTQTVSSATQEQLASMEEIAAASQALANMAQELQDVISGFRF